MSPPAAGQQPLRFGVIGIGNIMTSAIAPAILGDDTCELVAVTSRDQSRAESFAAEFGAGFATTEYRSMLERPDVDAVFIATPNAFHAEQVIAAARAGKHVLCDKPLAMNVPEARAAVEACAQAGVELGINFHNRPLAWVNDTRTMIADGLVSAVQVIEAHVGSGPRVYTNWRADPSVAGLGSVHNVGVHVLDVFGFILDSEPVEVTAMFDQQPSSGKVEMLAMILIRFDNGALGYLNCNERIAYPRNNLTVYGSSGRIVAEDLTRASVGGVLRHLTSDGETAVSYPAEKAYQLCLADFAAAVLGGFRPRASALDGLRSVVVCDAIARSVRERQPIEIARTTLLSGG